MSDSSAVDGWKEWLIALPVLGSALAVTYDVGYFWGLNINFFTVFSISEHITFALQVIPLALFVSSFAFVAPMAMQHGRERGRALALAQLKSGKSRAFYKDRANWFAGIWLLVMICIVWYWPDRSLNWVTLIAYLVGLGLTELVPTYFIRWFVLIAFTTFVAFCAVFAAGFDTANGYRKSDKFSYTVTTEQGDNLKAKVVRSGEHGLLFYEESTKHLVLLPWSKIKKVMSD